MSDKPDAVFIVAGHHSLICECQPAARGWKVTVYEQAEEPGNAVKTGKYE